MTDLPVTTSMIEYRVIHPDGTVLWSYVVPSHADTLRVTGDSSQGVLHLSINGLGPVLPPWVLQRREYGPEWVTIAER